MRCDRCKSRKIREGSWIELKEEIREMENERETIQTYIIQDTDERRNFNFEI